MSATDRPVETPTAPSAAPSAGPPSEPTAAELVLSVLAAARSLTLTTEGHRVELVGLHSLEATDRLLLNVPADSHLAAEIATTAEGDLPASVEFTDVAPVAVPDRVRARVQLRGWLSVAADGADPGALLFKTAEAELAHEGRTTEVEPEDLARAEPDPLAATEAEILTHLADAHGDAVELLAQLVPTRLLAGVTRVDPLRLDRYGIVLRLQRTGDRHDVRLTFPNPLCNPAHAVLELRTLLTRARRCPRRSRR
jgi:hypothetical protein